MVFGLGVEFIIAMIISILVGFATKDFKSGLSVLIVYIIIITIWRILR